MLCFWSSVNSVCSVGLPTPPVNLCKSVQSVGGLFSTLLQNRLVEDVLPQISQILTDGACLEFCEFCVFCGSSHAPVDLCKSVQSVGGLFSTLLQNRLVEDVLPQNSQNSQNRLAEMFSHRIHRFSQMLCFWSSVNSVCSVGLPTPPVDLQSVGGLFWLRGALLCWCLLQGVQQSLLHQPSKQCTSALLVHLRQVHPL